ncbi:MAG: acetylornithine transaminase [Selenomonadales bacterium]|nr:acetylornithine transaminase [Selenomonadales bacterium]MDY3739333.1 acetylornithine transaminase [Selenomonadaceae bacterium]MEE1362187.1 acetylornithine transaminase [Selenomonadaceae bacterium]
MTDEQIYESDKRDYLPVFARYQIVLDHGEGVYVYDTHGKKYIDFLGGIAVNVLGHNHPALVKAVAEQAGKMIHCSNLYYTQVQADAAEKLTKLSGFGKVFFGNSGAEANEGAIKVARKYAHTISPDKSQIITALHSFHGRTLATLTATGQPKYQEGFGPLPAGFDYVEYNNIEALEKMMSENTAAVMLEPIQGEGGVHVPTAEYLKKVRALCDKYNAVLIFDEIQTGIGRSGEFFAYDKFGVKPDVVTLAKGLAGGVPIGAFITSDKIADVLHAGDHGSTFGGNPLACAAADVVLATVGNEAFLKHVEEMGDYMKSRLEAIKAKFPTLVKEVRGVGLILGMEINKPGRDIVNACLEKGSIINCTAGNVLRFVPPLIVEKEHIDEVCDILEAVLPAYVD